MTIETGRRMWVIAIAILMWTLAGSSGLASTAHAAPQVDPTGSNFTIWGSPSFNRQIGPDDVVVQVAGGYDFTVSLLSDGSASRAGAGPSFDLRAVISQFPNDPSNLHSRP